MFGVRVGGDVAHGGTLHAILLFEVVEVNEDCLEVLEIFSLVDSHVVGVPPEVEYLTMLRGVGHRPLDAA